VKEPTVDRCPTLEELLQAGDCELSPEAHASVLAHLERCTFCQARDHHALRTLRDVQGYLAGVFGEERQQARREEFAAGLHKKKQARIHQSIGWPLGRWLPMAALLPVCIVALLLSRTGTVVLHADEVLQRAAAAERLRPRGSIQRVRVRLMPPDALAMPPRATASFTIVQELTDGTAFIAPSVTAASNGATSHVARLLSQHQFDWQQPLDVARFNAWRRGLPHRRDHVIALSDRPLIVLRTTTADDRDLREAELTVQRDNFHVVRAAFVFEGVGRLEIEELAQYVRHIPAASPRAETIEIAAARDRATLVEAELSTRLLLAQTGLDLPGTMRVTLTPEQVRIDGAWPTAAQRRALNGRLLALPHVSVNLRIASAIASEARAATEETTAEEYAHALEPNSALALFLEQQFADEHERQAFVPDLTRLTTAVRQRLSVMQLLAQRYSDAEIRAFSPEARGTWQHVLDWHYRQLRADLNGLDTRMRVLGGSESRAFPASTLPADWPRRTAAGLTYAIAFDGLVQELLAQQDRPLPAQNRGQDSLTHTFRALWDAVVGTRQAQGSRLGL
jgi:hypothetical protein